jgi:DNA-binding transcriptional ArsR family regulator
MPTSPFGVGGGWVHVATLASQHNARYDEIVPDDRCDLLCLDIPRAEDIRQHLNQAAIADVAARAKALGDPTRVTIAAALREGGELCVCDLAWITGRPGNLVGHHLRTLRAAGLASSRREHKIVFYALTPLGTRLLDSHFTATPAGR